MKILIVEDNPEQASMLKRLLIEKIECECIIASTLEEALTCAQAGADITLLDLHLDDKMLSTIKAIPLFPKPVIVLTEMDDPSNRIELLCYAFGAENFFSKKFLHEIILAMPNKNAPLNGGGSKGNRLISAITSAYFRTTLPAHRDELLQDFLDGK